MADIPKATYLPLDKHQISDYIKPNCYNAAANGKPVFEKRETFLRPQNLW